MVAKLKRQAKDDALKAELDLPNQSEVTEQVVQKSNKKSAIDPNIVQLKMRLQGLKKVHSIELQRSSALSELLPYLKNISDFDDNDVAKVQVRHEDYTRRGDFLAFVCSIGDLILPYMACF